MTINKLREAMARQPCREHESLCPIPKKGRKMPCQWGHTAMEFADDCDSCATIVLDALKNRYNIAQRIHHHKERK